MIGNFLSGAAAAFRHLHRESVGSTNTDLIEIARDGDPGNLWLTADEQLTGRGSRGRNWVSVSGNLYSSLLLIEPSEPHHFHQLTFVAAVALRNALTRIAGDKAKFEVKWPNDVLCGGRKCAGILLEAGQASKVSYVVIGMGTNVSIFPDDTMHKATSLHHKGIDVTPSEVFIILAAEMAMVLQLWDKGAGFSHILNAWREHAFGIGEVTTVRMPNGKVVKGRFASIDDKGYMVLQTNDLGKQRISTADIFFAEPENKD